MFSKYADSTTGGGGAISRSIESPKSNVAGATPVTRDKSVPKLNPINLAVGGKNTFNDDIQRALKTPVGSDDRRVLSRQLLGYANTLFQQKRDIVSKLVDRAMNDRSPNRPSAVNLSSYATKTEGLRLKQLNREGERISSVRNKLDGMSAYLKGLREKENK